MKIDVDDELRILRLTVTGDIDTGRYRTLASTGNQLANEFGYHMLWDLRTATLSASIADLYYLQTEIEEKSQRIRAAGLVSEDDRDKWDFVVVRNYNIGFMRKVFTSEPEALDWLVS